MKHEFFEKLSIDYPKLKISSVRNFWRWLQNNCLLINSNLVFRISNNAYYSFESEKRQLEYIQPHISTQIPKIIYIGSWYCWYKLIDWIPLSSYWSIPSKSILTQIAQFIGELHCIQIKSELFENKISVELKLKKDRIQFLKKYYQWNNDVIGFLKKLWDYLDLQINSNLSDQYICLSHDDLSLGNIIIDADWNELNWIIDFSDSCINDVYWELSRLIRIGKKELEFIVHTYSEQRKINIDLEKIRHYAALSLLWDIEKFIIHKKQTYSFQMTNINKIITIFEQAI